MPLRIYRRPSGLYHIRGTHHGVSVDRSARTRVAADAERVKEALERDIFERVVLGKPPEHSFAEAALGYMRGGGERRYLTPILERIGAMALKGVTQSVIDDTAAALYPERAASTLNRQVYTPIAAVLNWAADEGMLGQVRRVRRPAQPAGRVDWRRPGELELVIEACPHPLSSLITQYVGTGARASELLQLDWCDVSPAGERIVLWETKGGYARHVPLQSRARAALPKRPKGGRAGDDSRVWARWGAYDAVNTALRRATRRAGLPALSCHTLRHSWATWTYAMTQDLRLLMQLGGWRSVEMAMRYVHAGSPDVADEARAYGWEAPGESSRPALRVVK